MVVSTLAWNRKVWHLIHIEMICFAFCNTIKGYVRVVVATPPNHMHEMQVLLFCKRSRCSFDWKCPVKMNNQNTKLWYLNICNYKNGHGLFSYLIESENIQRKPPIFNRIMTSPFDAYLRGFSQKQDQASDVTPK